MIKITAISGHVNWLRIRMFILTKEQSQTKIYKTNDVQYNIIWYEQQAAVKRPMVFQSSSSLESFIKSLNKEHQKEIKKH